MIITKVAINSKLDTQLDITTYNTSTAILGNVTRNAIFCKYDLTCGVLQASMRYWPLVNQTQNSIN